MTPSVPLLATRVIVTLGLLSGLAVSWKLWFTAGRAFPVIPVGSFPRLPPWCELVLLVAAVASLVAACFRTRFTARLTLAAIACLFLLALGDRMRWQPWAYQYWLSLIPLLWLGKVGASRGLVLAAERMIIVAVYFWSGAHKIGDGFYHAWAAGVAQPLLEKLDGQAQALVAGMAHAIAPMEIAIAIALLIPVLRKVGVVAACLTHVSILILIGPLLGDHNPVVWPWNVAMMALVVTLFWPRRTGRLQSDWEAAATGARAALAALGILLAVMPLLSLSGRWPQYLSFYLYSGKQHRFQWVMNARGQSKLTAAYRPFTTRTTPTHLALDADSWSLEELRVSVVTDPGYIPQWYRAVGKSFEARDGFFYLDMPNYKDLGWLRFSHRDVATMRRVPSLPPAGNE